MPANRPATTSSREATASARSRKAGPWHWFCELSLAARIMIAVGVVFGLFCVFFAEENWRGRRAWENCQRQLEARGVELDWSKFVPPPVPDDQNFAMTPFLAPLFNFNPKESSSGQGRWRDTEGHERAVNFAAVLLPMNNKGEIPGTVFDGHLTDLEGALSSLRAQTNAVWVAGASSRTEAATAILAALEKESPVIDEIRRAASRPQCRFNIEYDTDDPISILLPHYIVLQRISRLLQVQASAKLALGKTDEAFEDAKLILYLASATENEPFLMAGMASGSVLKRGEQILWEGLAKRAWSDAQLQEFQRKLNTFAILKELARELQSERAAFGNAAFRYIRGHKNALRDWVSSDSAAGSLAYLLAGPEGWLYQEQVAYHRLFDQRIMPCFEPENDRVFPGIVKENKQALELEFSLSLARHHTGMAKLMLANLTKLFLLAAIGQERLDEANLVCALERWRLANGKYPDTLEALSPKFMEKIPPDVCDGQPLRFRLLPNGQFLLYGVGWNEKDDGGLVVRTADGSDTDPENSDWVWPAYPKT